MIEFISRYGHGWVDEGKARVKNDSTVLEQYNRVNFAPSSVGYTSETEGWFQSCLRLMFELSIWHSKGDVNVAAFLKWSLKEETNARNIFSVHQRLNAI